MAENDKSDKNNDQGFDDRDEELELDLFDDGLDPIDEDPINDLTEGGDDDLDYSLPEAGDLASDVAEAGDGDGNDGLDDDIIDLSDDDLQQEFAALDREEARNTDLDSDAGLEDDEIPTLSGAEPSDPLDDKAGDPDDLYLNMTSEEFGAPDRYSSESGATTRAVDSGASKPAGKTTPTPTNSGLPAILAALTALSPRMIVAATAAVLLPVVLFATLGFNSDQSDADEPIADATFVDQSDNNAASDPLVAETSAAETPAAETSPPRIEPPQPERIQVPELPGVDAPDAGDAVVAMDDEPVAGPDSSEPGSAVDNEIDGETNNSADGASQQTAETSPARELTPDSAEAGADEPVPERMLAQVESVSQQNSPQDTGAAADSSLQRMLASNSQDADGQQIPASPETSAPEPVSDHSPESALTEDSRSAGAVQATGEDEYGGRNYHVVVASFVTEDQARQHAERISDQEIAAYVIPPFGSSSNYRVAVAGYSSMAKARENIPGLQAIYGTGIWPLRYPPSSPLRTISERTGDTFIIVASFPTAELARTHASGLVADGEQPVLIAPFPPANRYRVAVSYFDSQTNAENALPRYRQNYGEDVWLLRY